MKKDKLKIYLFAVSLLIILFLALFVLNSFSKIALAIFLVIFAIISKFLIKKKNKIPLYEKEVNWLMVGFTFIYMVILYLLGLYFGFYRSSSTFNFYTIYTFIIPFTLIIISSEYIRQKLINQKGKFIKAIVFIIMVLIDLIIYSSVYDIAKLDDALTLIGFIFFSSVSCNLLYNYITSRFSNKGIIIYRLVTVLYVYLIPYIPNIYIFLNSFIRMLYPYLIYLTLEYTYSKTNKKTGYVDNKKTLVGTSFTVIILTIIICLISCQFKYGILVIGTGSMTGTIDKGDIILYEKYDNKTIPKETVIVYEQNGNRIIHRVVDVISVDGTIRYYTKGDANKERDAGYITNKDIEGKVLFRIKYLGYLTLWTRDLFN